MEDFHLASFCIGWMLAMLMATLFVWWCDR
jgi:hypothetical protein